MICSNPAMPSNCLIAAAATVVAGRRHRRRRRRRVLLCFYDQEQQAKLLRAELFRWIPSCESVRQDSSQADLLCWDPSGRLVLLDSFLQTCEAKFARADLFGWIPSGRHVRLDSFGQVCSAWFVFLASLSRRKDIRVFFVSARCVSFSFFFPRPS